jgi:hypothetical protein
LLPSTHLRHGGMDAQITLHRGPSFPLRYTLRLGFARPRVVAENLISVAALWSLAVQTQRTERWRPRTLKIQPYPMMFWSWNCSQRCAMAGEGSGQLSAALNSQTASSNESEPQLVGSTSATGPNHGKDDSEAEGFEREDTSPGPPNQQVLPEALARDRTSREPPR